MTAAAPHFKLFLQVVPVVSKRTYRPVVSNGCFQSSEGATVNYADAPVINTRIRLIALLETKAAGLV